jgi:hypothetical protein
MRRRRAATAAVGLLGTLLFGGALATATTTAAAPAMHERGRCAVRGSCGGTNPWDPQIPCADNGRAAAPEEGLRAALVEVCGEAWGEVEEVCCAAEQVCPLLAPALLGMERRLLTERRLRSWRRT